MFLFLIEIYLLGVLVTNYFSRKLPPFFLAVSSILVGLLGYALNGLILVLIGIPLTRWVMIALVSVEIIGLVIHQVSQKKLQLMGQSAVWKNYLSVGLAFLGITYFFFLYNFFFVTTDSVYLVVMARNLIESGFSEWFFASPRGMGLFVPLVQTLGILFGLDYSWFIQPILMGAFLTFFIFFLFRSGQRYIRKKVWLILLIIGITGLLFSADLIFIMTTYIHTNFNSGLFLFLVVATLYFGIREKNRAWFFFAGLFLIGFGLMRVENVIIALCLILIISASQHMEPKAQRSVFLPYLGFQFLLLLWILFIDTQTYSDQLSNGQILMTLFGILVIAILLFVQEGKFVKQVLYPRIWWLVPAGLLALIVVLGILNPQQLSTNFRVILKNAFITGNWGAVWWVITILFAILPIKVSFFMKRELASFILSFFLVLGLLGMFRVPYHDRWFDSANRMIVHIAPVFLFYVFSLIAKAGSLEKNPEL